MATPSTLTYSDYVDQHLMKENVLSEAAIAGHRGEIWAQTSGFPRFPDAEIRNIMQEFDKPGTHRVLSCGGTDHVVVQSIPRILIRTQLPGTDGGVIIMKTIQLLLIGTYNSNPTRSSTIVEDLGNFFVCNGL
ncbi:profilin-like [Rosa chinensis]|nr:profilin-like [Rosa chinensis]